jgi:hypothetical protein
MIMKGLWRYRWPFNLWGLLVLVWWVLPGVSL